MRNKIFRPKILNRKRINTMLSQIFEVPIFFISASMGYGKTISVKNFLEKKKDIKTIWFDTTNEENDDGWIWYKFCDAIKNTNLNLGQSLSSFGFPKNKLDLKKVIEKIREEVKQKTVIVIDDWYDERTIYIDNLIRGIALEEIFNLHIVIISRNKPASHYSELEFKHKCLVIRQDEIAYTLNETVEFFEINGVLLTEEEEKKVYEYTGGWTSATYLALIQYNNQKTFDNIPKATELIKIAVYDKFDEITKQILLKLALVDKFTLDQAIYLTENKKSSDVIQELFSNNCFIRYDTKSKTYTLHYILRSALREEVLLSDIDIDIDKINNACGDWYYGKLNDIEAIEYYFKANNIQRILDLIERNNTIDLTNLWDRIIKPIFEQLSMEEKVNRPIAYLLYIFFYILYVNTERGKELLYDLWVIYEMNYDLNDRNQVLGDIAFIESLTMFDDTRKMMRYHKKAYDLLEGKTSRIANNRMPVTLGSPHLLCLFHKKKGELKNIVAYLNSELKYFICISNGGAAGSEYLINAEYLFETGDSCNGEILAHKALHKAALKNQTSIAICSIFLLMRIYVNKNEIFKFRSKYDNLVKDYQNLDIPKFLNGTEIALGYMDGITGNLANMHKWIENVDSLDLQIVSPFMNLKYIVSAFGMVLKRSYIELEIQAEIMLENYSRKNNMFGIINAYIFDAIAKCNLYGVVTAKEALLNAIDLAKEDNIVMCFIELAPHILPIIREIQKESEYAEMLLPKCESFNQIYKKNYSIIKNLELSSRELEIMKLVDEGFKQSEISKELNIALATVKKHMSSVYLKLNVKNKTIAINLLKIKGIL